MLLLGSTRISAFRIPDSPARQHYGYRVHFSIALKYAVMLRAASRPILIADVMEMQLSPREASLVEAYRKLSADTAAEVSALTERLATLAPDSKIDWSDSWSDEDLREFRAASLRRLDCEELEDSA